MYRKGIFVLIAYCAHMKAIYDSNYRKLIGWLAAERKFKSVTQEELASALKYPSHNYISKIETFDKKLSLVEYVRFCEVLELDPREGIELLMTHPIPEFRADTKAET